MANATQKDIAASLAGMSRSQLTRTLGQLDCPFTLDFTDEYLKSISLERLRHIVLAAWLHARATSAAGA
ncbi:MAG TPA: hypothetical protein VNA25_06265 [Phycisphaerae bacterium]|nr:hypothetical protein [Phycisphaerae bacterium]